MKEKPSPTAENLQNEISAWAHKLHEAQRRLQELTGGQVDAVLHHDGHSYLLHDAQEKLRTNEETQRILAATQASILNALPAHIALLDPHGVIIAVNEGWQRFAQSNGLQSSESCPGYNYLEICEQADGDCGEQARQAAAGIRRVLAGAAKDFSLEYPCHSPTEQRWFQLIASPLDDTSPSRAAVMHINITERKLAEQAVRQSEEKFRSMFTSAAIGIAITTPKGHYLHANEVYCRMLGYTEEELLAGDFISRTHPDDLTLYLKLRDEMLSGQRKSYLMEKRYLKKNGAIVWTNASVSATYSDERTLETFVVVAEDITQRKNAEDALHVQTERLDLATRSAGIGIWDWNIQKDELAWDDRMYALYGIERDGFFGVYQAWLKGLHPDDRDTINEILMRAVRGEGVYDTEFRVLWPDGSTHTLKASGHVLRNNEGQPLRMIGVNYDITDRKQAEQAQRLSEERFSHAFEYAPNGIVLVSPDGRYITANRAFCELLSYSLDELVTMRISEISHPDDIAQEEEQVRKMISGEIRSYVLGKRYINKLKQTVFVNLRASLVRDHDDQPLYFIKQVEDVTAIKRAYDQIAQQAALIDEATDAIIVRDLNHRITFWSKGAERLYGWTAEDARGRTLQELLKPDPGKFAEATRAMNEAGSWNGEIQKHGKSGIPFSINGRWTLLRDQQGEPHSILTIDTDITDRKKLENQFLRAQRMESIGTLAGGIAHDLNNILAPILMAVQILKHTATDEQAKLFLDTIEVSTKRGADIVRQVLSFARGVEGDRIEVQPKHLLKDIESIIKDTFPKNIRREVFVNENSWTILGDPTQLHQILLNLCVNARDAMPDGGSLTVGVENNTLDEQYAEMTLEAKPGKYVKINVTDTGSGIPPEILDKIFEPFFTTKELGKGTGLGLSTVIGIVKSHHGFVNVYSELGKGTTFSVYLPAFTGTTDDLQNAVEVVRLPRGNGETVLIVDDEASILTITSQTLEAFGYRALIANDGAEAIAIYAQRRQDIDVVLTDMAMPVMDGSSTIGALLKINPAIKIIAASGLKTKEIETKASHLGIKHFLTKPYTAGTLLQALQSVLNEQ